MSKASINGNDEQVKSIFYTYSGAITFLFIAMGLVTFFFAGTIISLVAGSRYVGVDPVIGFNATLILKVLAVYGLLLPIDRMTGVGLDSVNRPHANAIKVLFMVAANIIGDIIAVFVFHSLLMVAIGSVIFTIVGIFIGFYFLRKSIDLRYKNVFIGGMDFYKSMLTKIFKSPVMIAQNK